MKSRTFIIAVLSLFASVSFAAFSEAPPAFTYKDGKAVFVDFSHAEYELHFDNHSKTVSVESTIDFEVHEAGFPVFDLVPEPTDLTLDGVPVEQALSLDPDAQTSFRILQSKVPVGRHQLKLKHGLTTNVVWSDLGVASAFWLSDLNDRSYLEQYVPSNLEFDQYSKKVTVNLIGLEGLAHTLKANGTVTKLSEEKLEVTYPAKYTSSSVFFHLFPEKSITSNVSFYYPSIDGRKIPVDIYTTVAIDPFVVLTKGILAELEADYGPFPHDQLLVYGVSLVKGGMEYSGATSTGLLSLGHELFHSYNARGVMPANGNSGWMDEGLSRWRDNLYRQLPGIAHPSAKLAGHSVWRRSTDSNSYAQGSAFLSLVSHKMNERGLHLKTFLKEYFQRNMFRTVTTEVFERDLAQFSGMDFSEDFSRYIYGRSTPSRTKAVRVEADPHHPRYTKKELLELTMPRGRR